MKARVTGNQPEKVLTFAIDQTLQPLLSETLQKLSIDEYRVPPEACGQSVGYLSRRAMHERHIQRPYKYAFIGP